MWASFAKQRSAKRMQLGQIWSFGIGDGSINNDSVARAKLDSSNFYYFQENCFFFIFESPFKFVSFCIWPAGGGLPGKLGDHWIMALAVSQRDTGGEREMIS